MEAIIKKEYECVARGYVPNPDNYMIMWDWDNIYPEAISLLLDFVEKFEQNVLHKHKHWAIYTTKHGVHLVIYTDNRENCETGMLALHETTHSDYPTQLEYRRLRISPKYNSSNGKLSGQMISPAPYILKKCECYIDMKTSENGKFEVYKCVD
jgi:hypothetical protein